MNDVTEEKHSNVIEVSFSSGRKARSHADESIEIDQWFDNNSAGDDLLEDLLNEFSGLEAEVNELEQNLLSGENRLFSDDQKAGQKETHELKNVKENSKLTSLPDYKLSYQDESIAMADTLIAQSKRINDDINRLKYFLDEMNMND